jgi:KaiC/GvpD/RAD55 family RecA-like ATPase
LGVNIAVIERISSGVEGLDAIIEGGFPRGSLILLAGNPGTGKTVLSAQFLLTGASSGESGVYVSFAESQDVLIKNISTHLDRDVKKLTDEGKVRILDFLAMKEEGLSVVFETILSEVQSLRAERLVIDSFSAMAQAFKEPIDARIVTHAVLSKIVRKMGCTTVMIDETPIGQSGIGRGTEEFVADGVIILRSSELDGRPFRDLELMKLRGTRLAEKKLVFTLERGFRGFPPSKPSTAKERRRFQTLKDSPANFSTGSGDLDAMLGGGYRRGATVFLEVAEKVSMLEYDLILLPSLLNFALQGRGVMFVPTSGVDVQFARMMASEYGATEDEVNRLWKLCKPSARGGRKKPQAVVLEERDFRKDYSEYVELEEVIVRQTGQPAITLTSFDTLVSYYGEEACERMLGEDTTRIRERKFLGIGVMKPGYEQLLKRLSATADLHLKLTREHGTLILYGVKPRTGLYAVETDVSGGYRMPRLTPIV